MEGNNRLETEGDPWECELPLIGVKRMTERTGGQSSERTLSKLDGSFTGGCSYVAYSHWCGSEISSEYYRWGRCDVSTDSRSAFMAVLTIQRYLD